MQVIHNNLVANGNDHIYQARFGITCFEESCDTGFPGPASIKRGVFNKTGQRVQLIIKRNLCPSDIEDLFIRKTHLLCDHGMTRDAIFTIVYFTYYQVHDFFFLGRKRAGMELEKGEQL